METETTLGAAFRAAGIEQGDSLIVHSSFRSLGTVEGGPMTVINALLAAIGSDGNLMLPTFNYTRPLPEPCYDIHETPARTGILPEIGRKRPDAVRSLHPTHSVAVIGPAARPLTEKHLAVRAFGVNSPIDLLAQMGGKILLIGVGQTSNSTLHVAEEYAGIPKVSHARVPPHVKIRVPGEKSRFIRHQLDSSPSCSAGFEAAAYTLRRHGAIRDARIGGCLLQWMNGQMTLDLVSDLLKREPTAMLCTFPECVGCGGTRQALGQRGHGGKK